MQRWQVGCCYGSAVRTSMQTWAGYLIMQLWTYQSHGGRGWHLSAACHAEAHICPTYIYATRVVQACQRLAASLVHNPHMSQMYVMSCHVMSRHVMSCVDCYLSSVLQVGVAVSASKWPWLPAFENKSHTYVTRVCHIMSHMWWLLPNICPVGLSGGQCKRVALAASLLGKPDLLVLDVSDWCMRARVRWCNQSACMRRSPRNH
jgi:hypothetical protein